MKSIRWPIIGAIVVIVLVALRSYVISKQAITIVANTFDCNKFECSYTIELKNDGNKHEVGKIGIYGRIKRRGFQLKSGTSAGVVFEKYEVPAFSSKEMKGTVNYNEPPNYLMFRVVNEW